MRFDAVAGAEHARASSRLARLGGVEERLGRWRLGVGSDARRRRWTVRGLPRPVRPWAVSPLFSCNIFYI